MSPVTHFLASWIIASAPRLDRRDVVLVTAAGIAPDVDGIGVVPELLTRNSQDPLDWFTRYHHELAHNLLFAVVVSLVVGAVAHRRSISAVMAFAAVHLHLAMDVIGSRGPDGYNWPIPYLTPFSSKLQISWSGQWALNAWQNVAITVGLLCIVVVQSIQNGRSPVEMVSVNADRRVVQTLRERFNAFRRTRLPRNAS